MQSVKGKVQSAAEGTNYSEPGMTFIVEVLEPFKGR